MRTQRHISRSDGATLLVAVVFLLGTLGAVGTAGRERAKRAICQGNLKQLTAAWRTFTEDHDGQLVNGAAGISRSSGGKVIDPWVGRCWASNYSAGGQLPEAVQKQEIKNGALWPYTGDLKLYRCPSGYPGEMLNYAIVDSMYGLGRSGTTTGSKGIRVGDTVFWVRTLDEIITPGAAERMVFIDAGWIAPDSYATHYKLEAWWDDPPTRHNDGATVSFADGHTEYWQWKGADTVEHGRRTNQSHPVNHRAPQTAEGREDLHRLQRAVWGRLGYEPSAPQ